jgi:DNA-binding NarL/FixJ family response regulator
MLAAKHHSSGPGLARRLSPISEPQATAAREAGKARNSPAVNSAKETRKKDFPAPHLVADSPEISQRRLRVLVVDDQLLVRAGICELVRVLPEVVIVGEANDGREALRLIALHEPDIVLMDIAMPGMNGLEALVLTKKQYPRVRVIILSEYSSEEFVFRALRAGAEGFLLKGDSVGELYTAIKSVAGGGEHLSPQVTSRVVFGYLENQARAEGPTKRLTPRQREVLQYIAEGKSTKEIASALAVSVNTVKTHRLKLMEKLGVHEITGVVRYAAKLGLIRN